MVQPVNSETQLSAKASAAAPSIHWQTIATKLFPLGHAITELDHFLSGSAQTSIGTIAVVGTCEHAPIGIEIALAQARFVLDTVREHPQRPILIMVDTQGQRLRHRDEMLGINSYMAHLGKCVDLARRQGHPILGLVYDQALSGGFITSGLMADACYALPDSTIRVMGLPAMARITKVPEERLIALASSNPVFAPGPENYLRMGGIEAIWQDDLSTQLELALQQVDGNQGGDQRSGLGLARGGRKLAQPVIDAILTGKNSLAS